MSDISGNFSTRKQRRIKSRAETLSQREVGNLDAVDEFIARAEGEIKWEDLEAFLKREGWEHVEAYPYQGPNGTLLYQAHRYVYKLMSSKKKFILRRTDAEGRIVIDAGPVRVPYNLPDILKRKGEPLVLVEGEKAVNELKDKGIRATCVQGQVWTDDVAGFFEDEDVIPGMDNDDAGRKNTDTAREWLAKVGAKVRVPLLPNLGRKQGLDDWIRDNSVEEFWRIVDLTKPEQGNTTTITGDAHDFPVEATIKMWDFLYGKHLLRGTVSGTAATGGTGKSSNSIVEALAMASGKPLLGVPVPRPLRVMLINLEDNRNTMDKRIAAAMKHHGLSVEDVGGRLFTKAKGEIKVKIAKQLRSGSVERNEILIRSLSTYLLENKIDVLSIDPFISTHGVNENDNSAIRDVVECYESIAEEVNCAVHLWHHTRKGNGQAASIDSARGAGSFVDACRSVRVLETMTKDEGKKLKIERAGYYFRAFNGKLNFAPPVEQSDWYRFVGVDINNGGPLFGDNVGVVEAWTHPGTKVIKLTAGTVNAIMKAVGQEHRWREDIRASMWVGKALAPILGLDSKDDKDSIKQAIKKLMDMGALREEPGQDHARKNCMFVVAESQSAPVHELERPKTEQE